MYLTQKLVDWILLDHGAGHCYCPMPSDNRGLRLVDNYVTLRCTRDIFGQNMCSNRICFSPSDVTL